MKKFYLIAVLLLTIKNSHAQWTRVEAIPADDIIVLAEHNGQLYAASDSNIIYKSVDGIQWQAMSVSAVPVRLTSMTFYQNEIYIGTRDVTVFHSADDGITWHNSALSAVNASRFVEHNNILYAATYGDGIYSLDTTVQRWLPFTNSLPFYSYVVQNMVSSPNFLIAGAGSNGTFYRYDFNSDQWKEEYYFGSIRSGLQMNRLINNGDTIWAVNDNRIMRSEDAGLTWVQDRQGTHVGADRNIYSGIENYYTLTNLFGGGTWIQQRDRRAPVNSSWAINEEFVPAGYSWDIIEFGNKLFLAKQDGLYVKLPNIVLAIHFTSFNASCETGSTILKWSATQQQQGGYFEVEKSGDNIHWAPVAHQPATGAGTEKNYLFADNNASGNNYYRIASHDFNGSVQYTGVLRSACIADDVLKCWPNPFGEEITISIPSTGATQAVVKIFDSKGAIVQLQKVNIARGSNEISIDTRFLARGIYQLQVNSNDGRVDKIVRMMKR